MEFLLIPAAGLLLAVLLAVQFLLHAVSYGPRSRRALAALAVPAAAVGVAGAFCGSARLPWMRLSVGLLAAILVYLAVATVLVLHWRERKVATLIGDLRALRRRLDLLRREVERLLWADEAAAAGTGQAPDQGGEDWTARLHEWLNEKPAEASRRRAQAAEWQAEFRRAGRASLLARSRVLEAAWREAPEGPERLARGARLAALRLALASLGGTSRGHGGGGPTRLGAARQEMARLEEEWAHLRQQREALLRRRLPLD